jgi:mono/diheme cytochrome c family protein
MRYLWLLLIPFVLFFVRYASQEKKAHERKNLCIHKEQTFHLDPNSPKFFEDYVFNVIKYGSSSLGFPTKMEGGYVSDEEAKKIAAYLATLQGFKPSNPQWVKEGAALYYGNCTGCHQKGVKSFPDLTRKPLLGIEKIIKSANTSPKKD